MKNKKVIESPFPRSQRRLPWWVSILLAIASYCCLKFVVPGLQLTNPTWQKLAQASPTFAPLVTIPFLLLAAKQLYDVTEEVRDEQDDEPDNNQDGNLEK